MNNVRIHIIKIIVRCWDRVSVFALHVYRGFSAHTVVRYERPLCNLWTAHCSFSPASVYDSAWIRMHKTARTHACSSTAGSIAVISQMRSLSTLILCPSIRFKNAVRTALADSLNCKHVYTPLCICANAAITAISRSHWPHMCLPINYWTKIQHLMADEKKGSENATDTALSLEQENPQRTNRMLLPNKLINN